MSDTSTRNHRAGNVNPRRNARRKQKLIADQRRLDEELQHRYAGRTDVPDPEPARYKP